MQRIKIPEDFLQLIDETIDITDVIGDYVVLKKRGKELLGLCPFHQEKTPSFTVNPHKQRYYCFGCGAGGGAIKFLMEIENNSFPQAVMSLSERFKLPINILEEEQEAYLQKVSYQEKLLEITNVAHKYYRQQLISPEGNQAKQYLLNIRHLSEATIEHFQLGYAPPGWDNLWQFLRQQGYQPDLIQEAGLVTKTKNKKYIDYFNHRIIFPIFDRLNRVIAFGGRGNGSNPPKYLNSPDTPIFKKKHVLYGLNWAKKAVKQHRQAIVVEGYMDAISLYQAGFEQVVAVLGTAFTPTHLKQISKHYGEEILFNFDSDTAGVKAVRRALNAVEPEFYADQVQAKIITLPQGKDVDDFLSKQPASAYADLIAQSPSWFDWLIQHLLSDRDLKNINQYNQIFREIVLCLQKIPNLEHRDNYLLFCAELLAKGKSSNNNFAIAMLPKITRSLEQAIASKYKSDTSNQKPIIIPQQEDLTIKLLNQAEQRILIAYIHLPEQRDYIDAQLKEKQIVFTNIDHRLIWREILELKAQNKLIDLSTTFKNVVFIHQTTRQKLTALLQPQLVDRSWMGEETGQITKVISQNIITLELIHWRSKLEQYSQELIVAMRDNQETTMIITNINHCKTQIIALKKIMPYRIPD